MKLNRTIVAPLVVVAVGLLTGGWFLQRGADPQQNVYLQARLFEQVLQKVSSDFVEPQDATQLYHMAIDGMLKELGDPHTSFLTPKDYDRLHLETTGEYGGLGMQIDLRDSWITVVSPLPGTPAERAGLRAGDQIIQVDSASTKGWTTDEAVARLRGPAGSAVNLQIHRVGVDQPIPFRVVRANIHVKSVPTAYMLDKRVGYIELTVFAETSTSEIQEAIQKLQAQGMKGVIIDLRSNPGGLLEQGVSLSDLFLKKGDEVVAIHGRMANMNQTFGAETPDKYPSLPVVLVVGPYTASAAEIFSGALQDHDRALVVGQTTYGKGSVQTLFPLSGGNYLKLTTARWYTPSGRSIQKPFHPGEAAVVDSTAPDTTALDRASDDSIYHTDDGRTVYGGGGIRPDIIIKPDTVTQAERDLAQALDRFGSKFNDAVYGYAIKYANTHEDLRPGFQVTPDMLAAFYRTLKEHGVTVDQRLYQAAAQAVSQRLAYEITYAKWGETGRRRRLNGEDPQIKIAEKVLDQATTPQSVFAVASKITADTVSGPAPAKQRP